MAEFDEAGPDAFLQKYGYKHATKFVIDHESRRYDSKAIVGVAHKYVDGTALSNKDFSGGEQTVVRLLRGLGFTVKSLRNPDWTRDEVVLACDLVARNGWRSLPATNAEVIALSALLQQLDIHPLEHRAPDFRNPNGVGRKTADIATQHPNYQGKPTNGGRHDREVLLAFLDEPEKMAATARAIRAEARTGKVVNEPAAPDLDLDLAANEGRILERRHLVRERDRRLRTSKIRSVMRTTGSVACEACGFDFARTYGAHGEEFIECHHRVPLHEIGPSVTRLGDLVLLCSNCHRMIHRRQPWLTFEELCALIAENRSTTRSHR